MNFCGSLTSIPPSFGAIFIDVCHCLALFRFTRLMVFMHMYAHSPARYKLINFRNKIVYFFDESSLEKVNLSWCLQCRLYTTAAIDTTTATTLLLLLLWFIIWWFNRVQFFFDKQTAITSFAELIDVIETEKIRDERTHKNVCLCVNVQV